ncbi:MAG: toll/interleukin-1 receptor domain-containing protein [Leptolyngbyaceae cyanobacterium SM2_3_12]|nr:toll/interleukin-1 receptor domain-containing protein [Leptolyngbyaceae cyanobacterium SM2_3_12]
MADVFISYARVDQAFIKALYEALVQSQREVWVDWADIPLSADWWKEIQGGIEAANTFIFVISPDSLLSKVCRQEIDYAVASHKRFIPIVRREGFARDAVPPCWASITGCF